MNINCDSNFQWFSINAISTVRNAQGLPSVVGFVQLFNAQQNASQPIEGFCSCFGNVKCLDDTPSSLVSFIDKKQNSPQYKLIVTDISPVKRVKVSADVQMTSDNDFPVLMNFVENYGVIFLATNSGNLYIYEITKGVLIVRCKISEDSLMFSSKNSATGGMIYISKSGKVISVDINKNNFLPFIMNCCKGVNGIMELCTNMAGRYALPGAENIFLNLFQNYMQNGQFAEAAKICRDTPGTTLRNLDTINKFKSLQGNPQPILVYFQTMMEKGKLNDVESVEMATPLVQQNRTD